MVFKESRGVRWIKIRPFSLEKRRFLEGKQAFFDVKRPSSEGKMRFLEGVRKKMGVLHFFLDKRLDLDTHLTHSR
ncbi:hypothetical protein DOM22_07030 [Bdellovibrio sp. ZAP7]|nr:hypothetical protein DOM22_07030 [Bdellovibrio sp. ZAP7]